MEAEKLREQETSSSSEEELETASMGGGLDLPTFGAVPLTPPRTSASTTVSAPPTPLVEVTPIPETVVDVAAAPAELPVSTVTARKGGRKKIEASSARSTASDVRTRRLSPRGPRWEGDAPHVGMHMYIYAHTHTHARRSPHGTNVTESCRGAPIPGT